MFCNFGKNMDSLNIGNKIYSSMSSFPDNTFVGQSIHGVLDGSFDIGCLSMVREKH
jgi:hypothetical protein